MLINSQLSAEGMRQEVLDGQRTLDTFRQDVQKYLEQQHQIQALPAAQDCGIVRVNLQVCVCKSAECLLTDSHLPVFCGIKVTS